MTGGQVVDWPRWAMAQRAAIPDGPGGKPTAGDICLVLGVLAAHADADGVAFPSVETIGRQLGLTKEQAESGGHRRQMTTALSTLAAGGFVREQEGRRGQRAKTWRLIPDGPNAVAVPVSSLRPVSGPSPALLRPVSGPLSALGVGEPEGQQTGVSPPDPSADEADNGPFVDPAPPDSSGHEQNRTEEKGGLRAPAREAPPPPHPSRNGEPQGPPPAVADQPPPRYCPRHPDGTTDRCWDCGDARRAREQWDTDHAPKPTGRLDEDRNRLQRELAASPVCVHGGLSMRLPSGLWACPACRRLAAATGDEFVPVLASQAAVPDPDTDPAAAHDDGTDSERPAVTPDPQPEPATNGAAPPCPVCGRPARHHHRTHDARPMCDTRDSDHLVAAMRPPTEGTTR